LFFLAKQLCFATIYPLPGCQVTIDQLSYPCKLNQSQNRMRTLLT
jgi:hypothetical protein